MFVDKGIYLCKYIKLLHKFYCITDAVSAFLQDLHKVEAKFQEKQLKEKEEEERHQRIAAKLKEKVRVIYDKSNKKNEGLDHSLP